jgi:hypothetical protein
MANPGERWTAIERVAAVGLALGWLIRWPFHARYLYEWDSGQYALGALEFDVYRHQPHPPGYPLWILLLKGLRIFVPDLNLAQILLSFLLVGASAAVFYLLARRTHGRLLAVLGTTAVLCAPPVVMYSVLASTYPIDLFFSAVIGLFAARLWAGEQRLGVAAAALLGLFAGLRQSGAVLMAPLLAVALWRAYRTDWRRWLQAVAAGAAVTALWYLPTALLHGGIGRFQKFVSTNVRGYFGQFSVFYGAPPALHREMLGNIARWTLIGLGPAAAMALVAAVAARRVRAPAPPSRSPGALFYAAWILPNAAYVTAFHCPKPGYLLLTLPPLVLALLSLARPLAALPLRGRAGLAAVCLAALTGWASTAIAWTRWPSAIYNRSTLASIRQSDRDHDAIRAEVHAHTPEETVVVSIGLAPWGPNFRTLSYHLPEPEVWLFLGPDALSRSRGQQNRVEYGPVQQIPAQARRILWIHHAGASLPVSIRTSFPATRLLREGLTTDIWASELGEGAVDARVSANDQPFHLVRAGRPRPVPECQLGRGFGELTGNGDLMSFGPSSEIAVLLPGPEAVRLTLEVAFSQPRPQTITALLDGRQVAELTGVEQDRELMLDFDGAAGTRLVTLRYARWNGSPDFFSPDRRPFAVTYRRITCQFEGRTINLVP